MSKIHILILDVKFSQPEAQLAIRFEQGDRVRVIQAESPYTGCRGTIADASGSADDGQPPLDYHVAIDGENGVVRPSVIAAREHITAVSSPRRDGAADRAEG